MWKPDHRIAAERSGLRYPSDLTDGEWVIVAPMIPPGKRGGRPRKINVREVLNGVFYVLWTGCQWESVAEGPAAEELGVGVFQSMDRIGTA
jgi:transposase